MSGQHRPLLRRIQCTDCGKQGYFTRREAKAAAKAVHPGDTLSVYRCPGSGYWHYGHLPNVARHGQMRRPRGAS